MFLHRWDAPSAWKDDLRSISPPYPGLSHAELVWEPGFRWMPVQRWVIYDCVPVQGMRKENYEDLAEYLSMEHPCTCPLEWKPTAEGEVQCSHCLGARSPVRAWIHKRFFGDGYWCQPCWVIQGSYGGHRPFYTAEEQQAAAAMGLPSKPPQTGALPYAPWDRRVKEQIRRLDLAGAYAQLRSARMNRKGEIARAAREARMRYMAEQFGRISETISDKILDFMPRDESVGVIDWSAAEAKYIETGSLSED